MAAPHVPQALKLSWSDGDNWQAALELPPGAVYEYKYVVVDSNSGQPVEWQRGGNAVLSVGYDDSDVAVFDNWGNDPGAKVTVRPCTASNRWS